MKRVLLAVAIVAGAEASAEPPVDFVGVPRSAGEAMTGTRLAPPAERDSIIYRPGQQVAAARRIAECFVGLDARRARRFLETPTTPASERSIEYQLPFCMSSTSRASISMSNGVLRGMLAEALLASAPPAELPVLPVKKAYGAAWIASEPGQRAVDEMGLCLAETHPAEARALVTALPGTPAAAIALARLTSYVGGCLSQNTTLKTDGIGLRATVAEALYHRTFDGTGMPMPISAIATKDAH